MAGVYNPVFYVEIFSLSFIADQNLAFYLLPILQAANILGRLVPSFFADRTGSLNMVVPALGAGCVLSFTWIGVVNEGGVIAWAVFYGTFFGLVQSIAPTCVVALTDKVQLLGTRLVGPAPYILKLGSRQGVKLVTGRLTNSSFVQGICFAIGSLGILVGPPIAGAILNDTGRFLGLQIFTGVLISAALGFALAARVAKVGWGMRKL
ncbi:hypothetical protein PRZ48_012946 [Zasmidium cellare]|uniref:Uncharacterized protein n=1 Tax=Zasmidium cellare TaxID=395010 RepID=A0ABR0E2M7_ZASCE|nr:hypothetical protein PRZ48_012946 [Zasmidium cellare]